MHTLFLIIHYLNVYIYHFSHIVCNDTHFIYCCNKFGVCLHVYVIHAKYMTIHYTYVQIVYTYPVLSSFVNDSQLCVSRHSFNNKKFYNYGLSLLSCSTGFSSLYMSPTQPQRDSPGSQHINPMYHVNHSCG